MLDIAATVENRKTKLEWVQEVSSVISIPLTVGGGIRSLEDILSLPHPPYRRGERIFEKQGPEGGAISPALRL